MHLPRVFNLVVLCLCTANGASAAPIHDAAASGDVESLRALVRSGVSVNSQEHQFGLTPLMAAAANGRLAAVEALIAMGASLSACNKPQFSVTTITAQFRQPEVLKLLLAKGGDPNGKPCSGPVGPLQVATSSKDAVSVELLLARGANPNVWGPGTTGSRTPLHVAAFHGELRIVRALLARGARVDASDEKGDRMTARSSH
jgi:ankyrin repeat protein